MSGNPYVVTPDDDSGFFRVDGPVDDTENSVSWTDGVPVLDSALDSAVAFKNGDWVEGGLDAFSTGLDVMGAIMDPFGTLGSLVAGWFIEHLGPVQDLLDKIAGDPDAIYAESATWHNVAQGLENIAADYLAAAVRDTAPMDGLMIIAYRSYAAFHSAIMNGMAQVADAVGAGITVGGTIVAGVRDFLQQALTDLIGQLLGKVAEALLSVGILAPHALATAANKCRELITRAQRMLEDLSRSLDRMAGLLHDISPKLEEAAKLLSKGAQKASQLTPDHFLTLTQYVTTQAQNPTHTDEHSPYV